MHHFELASQDGRTILRATGSTRAGLVTALVKGLSVAQAPMILSHEETHERPFSIATQDFTEAVAELLQTALAFSAEYQETYDDVSFSLITDKKIQGQLLGKAINTAGSIVSLAKSGALHISKQDDGSWQAEVSLQVLV